MKCNQILKIHGKNYKEMTKILLEEAKLEELIPSRECLVGIKPNLVAPVPAEYGATTHPEIVAGIIEYLQEHGYKNLVIAEGSWVGDKTSESMEVCGYDRLIETYHVEFCDTQKDSSEETDCAGMMLNLCSIAGKIDFLINVPVMKGHCQTRITCALKNLKGLLPNREKRRFHGMGLHSPIAHLNRGIRQDFVVVDHICGDLDFEDGGNPVSCDCIMAARDPVLVDAYVCRLLRYDVEEVPYIKMAADLGVGCCDPGQAEILEYTEEGWLPGGQEEKELPAERKIVELRDAVEEVESCSACYGYLIPALDRLREEGLLKNLDEKICIGQGYQGKTGHIGVGRCTAGFTHTVKGCPPTEGQIYEFLRTYIEEKEKS